MSMYVYAGCMVLGFQGCRSDSRPELEEVGMGVPDGVAAEIVPAGSLGHCSSAQQWAPWPWD